MNLKNCPPLLISILLCSNVFAAEAITDNTTTFPYPHPLTSSAESRPHLGAILGLVSPEGSYNSSAEYGVDIGFQPYIPFSVGAELTHSRTHSNTDEVLDRTNLLAKVSYNFGGTIPIIKNSYVGIASGAAFKSDGTDFVSAPLIGFDIPLKESNQNEMEIFSIGVNAKYIIAGSSDPDALSINGVLKYWY
ncbi:MAG: hypothetical protein WA160_09185 [Pseudobdellovibrio sp.]